MNGWMVGCYAAYAYCSCFCIKYYKAASSLSTFNDFPFANNEVDDYDDNNDEGVRSVRIIKILIIIILLFTSWPHQLLYAKSVA